jgi:large subunit ribosomal protein L29
MKTLNSVMEKKEIEAVLVQISDAKRELLNLRFQKAAGDLKDTSRFKLVRADIARLYTKINEVKAS